MILEPTELGGFIVELEIWLFELKYYFGMLAILEGMGEVGAFPENTAVKVLQPKPPGLYTELTEGSRCSAAAMVKAANQPAKAKPTAFVALG